MLEAKKSRWFEKVFALYNRNLFKRRFHCLNVSGLEILRNRKKDVPLIIYANHSSWWDGLVAFEISRCADLDSYVMMEEKQLKKLFLFRKLGAFSVIREKPREAVKSLNYATKILTEAANRALWIFPQGEILPNDLRPLKFYNGLACIMEKLRNCYAVPVAMRYEFLSQYKPEIFFKVGDFKRFSIEDFNRKKATQNFEEDLTRNLEELKLDIINRNFDKFEKI